MIFQEKIAKKHAEGKRSFSFGFNYNFIVPNFGQIVKRKSTENMPKINHRLASGKNKERNIGMKISRIIAITGMCIAFTGISNAATKCVSLGTGGTYAHVGSELGVANWGATYTASGVSVPINGVAFCSSTSGNMTGAVYDDLKSSVTTNDNKNCWCKMVSPAVSKWVHSNNDSSASSCSYTCASNCAGKMVNNSSFQSAIISNLSD